MSRVRPALGAEFVGTGLLVVLVVGSGITVERLGTDPAASLFIHAVTVGIGLAALIAALGPVSGGHFNPAVTIGFLLGSQVDRRTAGGYVFVQSLGAVVGTGIAHLSFGEPLASFSPTVRTGPGLWLSELVATAVLVGLILTLVGLGKETLVPGAVGAWVAAAIVGTASGGFANPAVTLARAVTDTYAGISPASVPMFLVAQFAGAFVAVALIRSIVDPQGVPV